MGAKIVDTSREDKEDLQKQLGCMNGMFQLFDRRYLLGQRRHGHNQKRLTSGQSDDSKKEFNNESDKDKDKKPKKIVNEKHKASVESSRNSFSSSCSSATFSSLDCSKRLQTEQSSESSSPILHNKKPDSTIIQPPDIRNVVKDSMTREPRVVSVKRVGPTMKHIDSPRPVQYDEKDRNFPKIQEISWGAKEMKETSRYSCDGMESRYALRSTVKVKDFPRLSLDSKQSSINNPTNESRRRLLTTESQINKPGSHKRQSSSVVAKLMGLEVITDSINEGDTLKIKSCLDDKLVSISRSRNGKEFKHNSFSAITRIPLEQAPWKHEGGRGTQKPPLKTKKAPETVEISSPSVYGEIEKRLTELEFKTSGKDLRALKQILEAMQKTRRRSETEESPLDNSQKNVPKVPLKKCENLNSTMKSTKLTSESLTITGLKKVKVNHEDHRKDSTGRKQARDPTPRDRKATGRAQRSVSPSRNSETVSPRQQRSKNGIESQYVHESSSDSNRIRKQNMQPNVSGSKIRNSKTKTINLLQNNGETRILSQHGEAKVMSSDWTRKINIVYNPTENYKNDCAGKSKEQRPMGDLATLTMEQPSPVSVLDAFYTEETPSPVKKKSNTFNDEECLHFDEAKWNQRSSQLYNIKLENIKHLVHQIELLNSNDDETSVNHTASSPCQNENAAIGLYDEVMNIITADVNKRSEDWDKCCNEVPSLVLDIERLIFKDLINEVVNSEAGGRHRRQLFCL